MTTSDSALQMLASWLRPVLTTVDESSMEQARTWVVALAKSPDTSIEDLARAAFGDSEPGLVNRLEGAVAAATATYSPEGNTSLVSHLSAATLLYLVDDDRDQAVDIVCRCESLLFLGWTPSVGALPARLRNFADSEAKSSRQRISVDGTLRPSKKKAPDDDETVDETTRLSTRLEGTQALLNRVVDRMANVVNEFNTRLELLDEEVDALWWARSERSARTGALWSELDALDRAVHASMDVVGIVGSRLPTAGTREVLAQVIGSSTAEFELVEAVEALEKAGWSAGRGDTEGRAPFRPLAEGVELMRKFDGDKSLVSKALCTSLRLAGGYTVTTAALAQQILNENWLQARDD